MGSDRARVSFDPGRHYRSVVMQQGRVTLEADWNEAQSISEEELRHETLEIVGPAGSPDGGYAVLQPGTAPSTPFDFTVKHGTAYVGGLRLVLDKDVQYSNQSDWRDHMSDPDWVMPTSDKPASKEFVYLWVREQEVSATEDSALLDIALGGPDTAQRTRMTQHIVRRTVQSDDCAGGLAGAEAYWTNEGLVFDPATMRLNPQSTLRASFQKAPKPDPCEPEVVGGYLGADNQLIRIQITGQDTLVWGFDDASFLYRVNIDQDRKTLTLQSQPVDAFHQPQAGQAVEVLRSAALLNNREEYVASATGEVQTLVTAYNPYTRQIELPFTLPSQYTNVSQTPQAFLRVWQQQLPFIPQKPIALGDTGLLVTLDTQNGALFHVGDYWLIAVRPTTPTQLYPERYLEGPQPPEGPRMWACPLAAIHWDNGILKVDEYCLPPFDNLVDLSKHRGAGCCTVSLSPGDLTGARTLQSVVDSHAGRGPIRICLAPGEYALEATLALDSRNSNLTIEACPGGVTLSAKAGSESAFLQGLIALTGASNVSLRGLTFRLPLVLYTAGTGDAVSEINFSIGLRPVDCDQLSVEDCVFVFSGSMVPSEIELVAIAIFAGGECVGLRLTGNRFVGVASTFRVPVGFQAGFTLYPGSVVAGASANFLGSWLDEALLRNNFFDSVTLPVLVYADCGLVDLESNTIRNSSNGFMFFSLPALGYVSSMANVSVERAHVQTAVNLHNALYSALANPSFQSASAVLRGFPLPPNYTPSKAVTVTPTQAIATDISGIQRLYDQTLPVSVTITPIAERHSLVSAAAIAVVAREQLTNVAGTLITHPLEAIQPVLASAVALNQTFSAIEKQAFAGAGTRGIPVSLHFTGNDVQVQGLGGFSGLGFFVLSLGTDDRDTANLADNTCTGSTTTVYMPAGLVAGVSRCTVTGSVILNEGQGRTVLSLVVFPRGVTPSEGGDPVAAAAITGNVLRGIPIFPARNLSPMPAPPMDRWDFFNSIT